MVANLFLFIVLELASGFCNSLSPFLAVRALYGICMGVSTGSCRLHGMADTDETRDFLVPQRLRPLKTFRTMHEA
jgi:hypothetical protein